MFLALCFVSLGTILIPIWQPSPISEMFRSLALRGVVVVSVFLWPDSDEEVK